jgi:IclR family acetate operon transcriptional repressor
MVTTRASTGGERPRARFARVDPPRAGAPRGDASAAGQSQSLLRGLALLERLADADGGVTLTDLAQRVGLSPSTTHRLLNTLESTGFVHRTEPLGLWHVGVKAFIVGSSFLANRDLLARTHPYLRRLVELSGESANLAVLDEYDAVVVDQVQCGELMRMHAKLGSRVPLHASGLGKALLAAMSDASVDRILHKRGLPRITEHTLDTPARLWDALAEIRRRGYTYDDGEHAVGLRCLAATIHDEHGEPLAAISIAGPASRMPDARVPELGLLVARSATEITRAIGGRLPDHSGRKPA